jgi:hypothetical protein
MSFLNPFALLGLLSLPVIIYLHLLREHHRRAVVSHLALWSFLDHEPRGPRRRRIPLTWLLLLDLAAAALLTSAWAQPRLELALPVFDAQHRIIVLDISTSMRAREGLTTRFEAAQAEALSLVESAGPRDIVTVLAFGRRPYWVGDSRQMDRAGLLAAVQALRPGETGPSALMQALALGQAAARPPEGEGSMPVQFFLLTDAAFPLEASPAAHSLAGFEYPLNLHLFGSIADNQAVLDLDITPLQEGRYQVFVRIANFGGQPAARIVSMYLDGELVDSLPVEVPAESAVPQVWQLSANPAEALAVTVELSGADSLREDDLASAGLRSGGTVRVLLVSETPDPLRQALMAVPEVELQTLVPSEYNRPGFVPGADLVIFRGVLPATWPAAPVLVVEPPGEAPPGAEDLGLLTRSRQDLPPDAPLQFPVHDPLLAGIDFSGVRWSKALTLAGGLAGFETLLQAGESPLLLRLLSGPAGTGSAAAPRRSAIWVLLADLGRGNFTKHPAFPILMANLVESVRQGSLPPSVQTGEEIPLPPSGEDGALVVSPPEAPPAEFNAGWPAAWDRTLDPGVYHFAVSHSSASVFQADAPAQAGSFQFVSGANAGDAEESDLRPRPWIGSLPGAPGALQGAAEEPDRRFIDLAPWLLAAALLVLLIEAALAWRRTTG